MFWRFWTYRRSHPEPVGVCRRCGEPLDLCPGCHGAWEGAACTCGLGARCPNHDRHWI